MQTVAKHQRGSSEEETATEQGGRLGRMDKGESETGRSRASMRPRQENLKAAQEAPGELCESVPEGSWWTDRRPGSCAPGTEMEGDILGSQDIF